MSEPITPPAWTSGSPQQQDWATSLRQKTIDWTAQAIAVYSQPRPAEHRLANDLATIEMDRKIAEALPEALAKVMARFTDPTWWIVVRDDDSGNIAVAVAVARLVPGASHAKIRRRVSTEAATK